MHHNFLFASLDSKDPNTARKVHIRRVYDILQLCIQRNDIGRARKAWAILTRCKEFDWKSMWTLGVHLISTPINQDNQDLNPTRIEFLRTLMLQHPDQRESILRELVLRLIQLGLHRAALDELELYLPSFPYQDNPVLHIYAGLICLYLAQADDDSTVAFNPNLLRNARSHLERARSLDLDNIVCQTFLEKISFLSQSSNEAKSPERDSDEEDMTVDATGNASKRARR